MKRTDCDVAIVGFGPVGARLPIVQGTSFAFLPIMIPLVAGKGVDAMPALFTGVFVGGLFHAFLGTFIGKLRFALPPLVTGLVVLMIGLALVRVGIQYAAGGVPAMGTPAFGRGVALGRPGHGSDSVDQSLIETVGPERDGEASDHAVVVEAGLDVVQRRAVQTWIANETVLGEG